MEMSFWQKRVSRRRLLGSAASLAVVGGGAGLFLPRWSSARASQPRQNSFVLAEDIRHNPPELAAGQLQGLQWDTAGQPALRAAGAYGGVYTSPVVATTIAATHVGLHWRADGPGWEQISFRLRTATDGSTWSPWRTLYIEAEPNENPRGERFASLVAAKGARYVQYRALLPEGQANAPTLQQVTVTALSAAPPDDSFQAARATKTPTKTPKTPTPKPAGTPAPTSNAGSLDPPFASGVLISREDWGAPESYRYDAWGNEIWPRMYIPTKKIIVHHTATNGNYNTQDPNYPYPSYSADEAVQEVRAVYYYHAITLGWGDIGYNALIDRFGRIFEGRRGRDSGPHGTREIISPDVSAGHALNCNEGSTGISLIGNFEDNQLGPNEEATMVKTLLDFLTWSCRRFYIPPTASSDFLAVNWAWIGGLPNICGHRDVNATICPGQYVYARLPEWRQKVASQLAATAITKPSAQITHHPSDAEIASRSVSFSWKSPDGTSPLFSYYLEGWIPNLATDEEYYLTGYTADKRPAWSSFDAGTSATIPLPQAGRYTFHVRAKDSKSDGAYEDNWTFVAATNPQATYTVGAPGVSRR